MTRKRSTALAVVVGLLVALAAYSLLYWVLAFNASGVSQVYRHRYLSLRLIHWLELILFLPTLWVTKPLGYFAAQNNLLGLMTFAEISVLSSLYGGLAALLLKGKLTWMSARRFLWRYRFLLLGLLAILASVSLWARLSGGVAYNVPQTGGSAAHSGGRSKESATASLRLAQQIAPPSTARPSGGQRFFRWPCRSLSPHHLRQRRR